MTKTFSDWLQEGELLYNNALKEYQSIESQLDELEKRLVAKQAEVNQIAGIIGKPPVEGNRRLAAQLVAGEQVVEEYARSSPTANSNANIARALTGKLGR